MSGICGWIGDEAGSATPRELLGSMADTLGRDDGTRSRLAIGEAGAVAVAALDGLSDLHTGTPLAAVFGAPVWDDPGLERIAAESGPAAAAARGFVDRGPRVLESMHGAFAVAIVDGGRREGLLAIDRVGGRCPLNYRITDGGVIFGSSGDAVQLHPRGRSEIDPQGVFNYVYFHMVPAPGTIRRDVHRLLPGSYLHWADGHARVETYWRAEYLETDRTSVADLEAEFFELLRASIARDAADASVGCFLSGGTDSSTVAGVAGELADGKCRTFSMGFDAEGFDEMRYARVAARHFDTEHHEYYVKPDDVAELIPRIAAIYGDPFGNESAVPAYYCARLARDVGVDRMLAGDGGDELFAGNERYAWQAAFGLYQRVPGFLRSIGEPVVFGLPGGDRILPWRRLKGFIRYAKAPMPERMQAYNYIQRLGAERILTGDFLGEVDPRQPLDILGDAYHSAAAGSMLNRMLAMDARVTLADNDLPKVSRMCELAGIDVRYPLLSDEMIRFANRLRPGLKLKRFKLRWFWKHALRNYLPREVLTKKKHGFGLPFGLWLLEHDRLREIVDDALSGLAGRGIVEPAFLRELPELHRRDNASYYGVIIWILTILELWLRHHVDRPGGGPS